jgi:sugar fermentation stimulation protein A
MSLSLPKLQKAICLGKSDPQTIDVAVQDGPVQKLRCPSEQSLPGCTSLGSRIWFSQSQNPSEEGVWELVEVDGGFLTCVNPSRLHEVLLDAFENQKVAAYKDYPTVENLDDGVFDARLWDVSREKSILVSILPVLLGDEIHRGFFPHDHSPHISMVLRELIKAKYKGEDVQLVLAVANNGIRQVFLASHIDRQVASLIKDCQDVGIPIIAQQVICSLENISVGPDLPFKIYN